MAIRDKIDIELQYFPKDLENDSHMMRYMQHAWNVLNEKKFGRAMTMPHIRFMKKMKVEKMHGRGHWTAGRRTLSMSRRCFCQYDTFYEIFLHEMCHQAVSEIDKVQETVNGGHGPHWRAWMIKVGLDPLRYDMRKRDHYMTNEEREAFVSMKAARADAHAQERRVYPRDGQIMPAKYFDAKTKLWVEGMIICRNDQEGKRWAFKSLSCHADRWLIIPYDWFHAVSDEQKIRDRIPNHEVERVLNYYHRKRTARKARREVRDLLRYL